MENQETVYESCVICGKQTEVDIKQHVDFRAGYIEGAGQLCTSCYLKEDKNLFTVDGRTVVDTPNDAELGYKVRKIYWQSKGQ